MTDGGKGVGCFGEYLIFFFFFFFFNHLEPCERGERYWPRNSRFGRLGRFCKGHENHAHFGDGLFAILMLFIDINTYIVGAEVNLKKTFFVWPGVDDGLNL
jgi:hypothetical protein